MVVKIRGKSPPPPKEQYEIDVCHSEMSEKFVNSDGTIG
jgi:hypothetical protein